MSVTKKQLEERVAELEARLSLADAGDYLQGIGAAVKAIEGVKANSRGEYHGIIDRCLNAVSGLVPDSVKPEDEPDGNEDQDEPNEDPEGGQSSTKDADE